MLAADTAELPARRPAHQDGPGDDGPLARSARTTSRPPARRVRSDPVAGPGSSTARSPRSSCEKSLGHCFRRPGRPAKARLLGAAWGMVHGRLGDVYRETVLSPDSILRDHLDPAAAASLLAEHLRGGLIMVVGCGFSSPSSCGAGDGSGARRRARGEGLSRAAPGSSDTTWSAGCSSGATRSRSSTTSRPVTRTRLDDVRGQSDPCRGNPSWMRRRSNRRRRREQDHIFQTGVDILQSSVSR